MLLNANTAPVPLLSSLLTIRKHGYKRHDSVLPVNRGTQATSGEALKRGVIKGAVEVISRVQLQTSNIVGCEAASGLDLRPRPSSGGGLGISMSVGEKMDCNEKQRNSYGKDLRSDACGSKDLVEALWRLIPTAPANTASQPLTTSMFADTSASLETPIAYPAQFFTILVEECGVFLLHCQCIFRLQPRSFQTERSKFAYVVSLLSGQYFYWYPAPYPRFVQDLTLPPESIRPLTLPSGFILDPTPPSGGLRVRNCILRGGNCHGHMPFHHRNTIKSLSLNHSKPMEEGLTTTSLCSRVSKVSQSFCRLPDSLCSKEFKTLKTP
ncbi:hypothetical protein Baya_0050 [Bagarius yarrelli]|uniref:Uncharacterized protein n=1 Tax=Bagarius yarrelli TaxID=175774 RepID=A0A556TH50_BAGYA|nr:hypothetical protein Baya_0050 [Bagarius yarrelli]